MPKARLNDNKMYLGSLDRWNRLDLFKFLTKYTKAKHLDFQKFNGLELTEIKISPEVTSYFIIDGEIYPNEELRVKLLPSYLNLMGTLYSKTE